MKHIERFAVVIALILVAGTLALGNARTSGARTSAAGLRPAPIATLPPPIQAPVAGEATHTTRQLPAPRASGRHPRPEEIVRLPRADSGPGRRDGADAGGRIQRSGDPHVALADPGPGAAGTPGSHKLGTAPKPATSATQVTWSPACSGRSLAGWRRFVCRTIHAVQPGSFSAGLRRKWHATRPPNEACRKRQVLLASCSARCRGLDAWHRLGYSQLTRDGLVARRSSAVPI